MTAVMERQASQASYLSTTSDMAYSLSAPPFPLYPTPESLAPHLSLPPDDLVPLLRHAVLFATRHADLVLLKWLFALEEPTRRLVPLDATDDEGCNILTSAILGSSGKEDKEECARLIARSIGVEATDNLGWTPLHHAALVSTPALVSYLLTSGADPHAVTLQGLTPLDIVSDLPSHFEQTSILTTAMTSPPILPLPTTLPFTHPSSSDSTASSSVDHYQPHIQHYPALRKVASLTLPSSVARAQLHRRMENKQRLRREKQGWMSEVASMAHVRPQHLLDRCWEDDDAEVDVEEEKLKRRKRAGRKSSVVRQTVAEQAYSSGSDDSTDDEEEAYDSHEPPPYHTFLVFSLPTLPSLLDTLISSYAPNAFPRAWRAAPANAIYLFARFALYRCDDDWLEELVVGVVDKVEKSVYDNVDDLAYLAFWIYNSTLLLHLLKSDPGLELACHELNLFVMLEELINAIHVFIIRFIERRVDDHLDAALLDYEPMSEEFNDLSFEGEWKFLKNLTGRGTTAKRAAERMVPKAKDIFNIHSPSATENGFDNRPVLNGGNDGGRKRSQTSFQSGSSSPRMETGRPLSISDANHLHRSSYSSTTAGNNTKSDAAGPEPTTPRTFTNFLTSALVILQLYEVNPAVICQAFSQCYYWIGCETFNRILTRKKYLCRSKAVQIRMNLTALEDWVRESALPVKIATKHLEQVGQLLQWLQTCSSLDDFDSLIVTISRLRSLNPLQMRRAVQDYRFEVSEARMSDECAQYLSQLQKDWEKRRVRIGVETLQREVSGKTMNALHHDVVPPEDKPYNPTLLEPPTPIDFLFDPDVPLGQYNPPSAPEALGELLDSRFMLLFTLPDEVDLLAATPPKGAAFSLLHSPGSEGSSTQYLPSLSLTSPRPSSRSSFASLRPLRYLSRKHHSTKELPVEFLTWLDEEERAKAPRERRFGSAIDSIRSGSFSLAVDPAHNDRTPTSTLDARERQEFTNNDTFRRPSSSSRDNTLTNARSDSHVSPRTADVNDFGSLAPGERMSYHHDRDDSERTISSHGRDASGATIKRRPDRLADLVVDDGGYRPRATFEQGPDGRESYVVASPVASVTPTSPSSAKSWFKSLPKRKGTLKALISGN